MNYSKTVMAKAHRMTRIARSMWSQKGMSYREYFCSILKEVHKAVSRQFSVIKSMANSPGISVQEGKQIISFYSRKHSSLMAANLCD